MLHTQAPVDARSKQPDAPALPFSGNQTRQTIGRGDDAVGDPHRAQIVKFELFESILLLKVYNYNIDVVLLLARYLKLFQGDPLV